MKEGVKMQDCVMSKPFAAGASIPPPLESEIDDRRGCMGHWKLMFLDVSA